MAEIDEEQDRVVEAGSIDGFNRVREENSLKKEMSLLRNEAIRKRGDK